jgi:cholinesterase
VSSDPALVLSCMRIQDYKSIMHAMASTKAQFGPTIDDEVVFADYKIRGAAGNFIRKPLLIGDNNYEAGLIPPLLALMNQSLPELIYELGDQLLFSCPTAARSAYSSLHQVPTWRNRYFGEFPNLKLTTDPPSGAYHGAEIAIIFGTDLDIQNVTRRTPAEQAIGKYMRGGWAAFAKDPGRGLLK